MDLRALYWKQRANAKGAYSDVIIKRLLKSFQGQYRIKYVCRGCGHLVKSLSNNGHGWKCVECNKASSVEQKCLCCGKVYYGNTCTYCRQIELQEAREATNIGKWNFAG